MFPETPNWSETWKQHTGPETTLKPPIKSDIPTTEPEFQFSVGPIKTSTIKNIKVQNSKINNIIPKNNVNEFIITNSELINDQIVFTGKLSVFND